MIDHPKKVDSGRSGSLECDVTDLFSLKEACSRWPARTGRPLNLKLVYRWTLNGRRGVRLRSVEVPGVGRCTTDRWISQFVLAVNAPSNPTTPASKAPTKRRLLRNSFMPGGEP